MAAHLQCNMDKTMGLVFIDGSYSFVQRKASRNPQSLSQRAPYRVYNIWFDSRPKCVSRPRQRPEIATMSDNAPPSLCRESTGSKEYRLLYKEHIEVSGYTHHDDEHGLITAITDLIEDYLVRRVETPSSQFKLLSMTLLAILNMVDGCIAASRGSCSRHGARVGSYAIRTSVWRYRAKCGKLLVMLHAFGNWDKRVASPFQLFDTINIRSVGMLDEALVR